MGLRDLRERKGMTLRDLVASTGVAMQTLVNLEHGRTAPRANTLRRVAAALGMSYEALYDALGPRQLRRVARPRGE